jgi:phospholipid/cholesterol/gamma-HCH transport system substrate-binding protein
MPTARKVTWAQLRVGIVALFALVLLAILVFLLTGTRPLFEKEALLYTFLSDSAAMAPGAPVRLNGILIGRVSNVALSGEMNPARTVRVSMMVQENMLPQIPIDSEAAIAAENVLGSKFINIKRGQASQTVKPGDELAAVDTSDFEEVVRGGYNVLQALQGAVKRIDAILAVVERGEGSIGKLIQDEALYRSLTGTVQQAEKITIAVNSGRGTLGRLIYDEALYEDLRGTLARTNRMLDGIERGEGTAGKLLKDPALYEDVRNAVGEMRTLLADLNAGKGTAGKLLKDEELHRRIDSTVNRLDTMLARINSGEGTLGQLLVNPSMYENLEGLTREMRGLMKDFRANPKKFLRIKLALF